LDALLEQSRKRTAGTSLTTHLMSFTSCDSNFKWKSTNNTKPYCGLPPVHTSASTSARHVLHVRVTRLCFALKLREIGPAGVQIDSPQGPCNDFWYVNCEHSHSLLAFLTFLSVSRLLSISTTSLCARSGFSSNFCIWGASQEAKSAIMARPTRLSGRKPNCTDRKHIQVIRTVKG
jgi:hypothetical protein